MAKAALIFTYYIAAPVEKVWDGLFRRRRIRRSSWARILSWT